MSSSLQQMEIPCITSDGLGNSTFKTVEFDLRGESARMLSEQIPALNFRLRTSDSSYSSDWQVAGDPTLLIVLSGKMRIQLRNGEYKDFSNGDMFIAEDYLEPFVSFDNTIHGHRAEVVGEKNISVLHLKLNKR